MTGQSESKTETKVQGKQDSPDNDYPGKDYLGSVLLAGRIKELVQAKYLIVDDPSTGETTFGGKPQLKRAKYNVRLGTRYFQNGRYKDLDATNKFINIQPYELVFIESYEIFRIPDNVVARYDLRVSHCLAGLGLQVGLQLDTTYYGRFFCPLFNFSDQVVPLEYKNDIASVQFMYTTKPTQEDDGTDSFGQDKQGLLSLAGC